MNYDYIIIGTDPKNLTLAYYLTKNNKKIYLINNTNLIGGSYCIDRSNELYCDYGPKFYSDSFINFKKILKELDIDFESNFRKFEFNFNFNTREIILYMIELLRLFFNDDYSKNILLLDHLKKNNISNEKIKYIDQLCMTCLGTKTYNTSLYDFIQINNIQLLHYIYQPKKPIDNLLFDKWLKAIENTNNAKVDLNIKYKIIDENTIIINEEIIKCDNPLIYNKKGFFKNKSISLHYDQRLYLNHNLLDNMNINHMVLSDYMYFNNEKSVTVITSTSDNLISNENAIKETFNELKNIYSNLPEPDNIVIKDGYYDENIEKSIISGIKLLNSLEPDIKIKIYECDNFIEFIKFLLLIKFILFIFKM
jgi:hypothetical protein